MSPLSRWSALTIYNTPSGGPTSHTKLLTFILLFTASFFILTYLSFCLDCRARPGRERQATQKGVRADTSKFLDSSGGKRPSSILGTRKEVTIYVAKVFQHPLSKLNFMTITQHILRF